MESKYIYVYYPDHPDAGQNGTVAAHRLVAEFILGRRLKPGEVVHHKDNNRSNNSPDNLMVFKSQADHAAFHKGHEAVIEDDVYVCHDRIEKPDDMKYAVSICPLCGGLMGKASNMCKSCQIELNNKHLESTITKDELEKLIQTTSFSEIGRMFGVSDNAVRKWCVRYGLPRTKRELLQVRDDS